MARSFLFGCAQSDDISVGWLKTSQQQISRLESPAYAGHSLSTLRRVAEVCYFFGWERQFAFPPG